MTRPPEVTISPFEVSDVPAWKTTTSVKDDEILIEGESQQKGYSMELCQHQSSFLWCMSLDSQLRQARQRRRSLDGY
jgi:hypothetical protein